MKSRELLTGFVGATFLLHGGASAATIDISANDIGGQVIGDKGPEAGVWVIAETRDLPTKYAKVVVTDDQGRFVLPELPAANYKVWVRGYGLQDTAQQEARPGRMLDFKAVVAARQRRTRRTTLACIGIRCSISQSPRSFPARVTRATRCLRP